MQKLADTVRGVGANNVMIVGGLDWSYELDGIVNGYAVVDHGGNGIILNQREVSSIWVPKFLRWVDDNDYHITAWDFHHHAGPCLVENLDDFTPTSYWGAYVKEFLAKHNG